MHDLSAERSSLCRPSDILSPHQARQLYTKRIGPKSKCSRLLVDVRLGFFIFSIAEDQFDQRMRIAATNFYIN